MIFRKSEIEALCDYPRPEFRRETALLNRGWFRFSFSRYSDMNGFLDRFFAGESFGDCGLPQETSMPFVVPYEEAAPVTVFVKRFSVKPILEKGGCTVLRLCSGNWYGDARFFVNGSHIADTSEPYEPVSLEINIGALHSAALSLAVCVEPRSDVPFVGSGQPFWMEFCGDVFLNRFVHRYENGVSQFRLSFSAEPSDFLLKIPEIGWEADASVARKEETAEYVLFCDYRNCGINPPEWTTQQPHLLELEIETWNIHGEVSDSVRSYIGLRTVSASQSFVLLNGRPFYVRSVIHSGLYEEGLPFPPSRSGYFRDAMAIKNLGFNTVRYDSRIENPVAYFCADAVGLTVWQDLPGLKAVNDNDVTESVLVVNDIIDLLVNFPSVAVYVLFNENKGLPSPFFRQRLIRRLNFFYSYLKTKDSSRLVIDNSGFYHHLTDILDLHCVTGDTVSLRKYLESVNRREFAAYRPVDSGKRFFNRLRRKAEWVVLPDGEVPAPVVLSETGGLVIDIHPDEQTFCFLTELFDLIYSFSSIKGFCFRQFADTPTSSSGILKEDRLIKGSTEMWKSLIVR